jgi:hypothetical protein
MNKVIKLALVGGAVGAGASFLRSGGNTTEQPATTSASMLPTVAGGVAVGATVGIVLTRRSRAKAAKRTKKTAAMAIAAEMGRKAMPVMEQAAQVAGQRAREAAVAARPVVE